MATPHDDFHPATVIPGMAQRFLGSLAPGPTQVAAAAEVSGILRALSPERAQPVKTLAGRAQKVPKP